tara:strand:+ start:1456 stop:1884 length:429 start_codon:yes stop_codon:yes gene_type:complete
MSYNNYKLVAPWDQTKWIVASSSTFLIPSIYAYYKHIYYLSFISIITSFFSINFWRNATYSLRRKIDIVNATFAFIVFSLHGFYYINNKLHIAICYPGFFLSIYLYYCSNKFFYIKNAKWVTYHVLFHLVMTIEKMFIIYNI